MEPEISDPVDWSVDEVVSFLCGAGPAPWALSSKAPRPDPAVLGAALRDNDICGEVLMHVDNDGLKDMGIKAYGHRIMLMKAIQWLQQKSVKYSSSDKSASIEVAVSRTSSPYPHEGTPVSAAMTPNPADLITSPKGTPAVHATLKTKRRIAPTLLQKEILSISANRTLPDGSLSPSHATSLSQDVYLNIVNIPSNKTVLHGNRNGLVEKGSEAPARTEKEEEFLSYLLKKYVPEDDDAGLPGYGESGSEGEYDKETWQEIVQDHPSLEDDHPNPEVSRLSGLSREECDTILAQYITDQEELWRQKVLPKKLSKAEGLWRAFRTTNTLEDGNTPEDGNTLQDGNMLQDEKLRRSNRIEHLQDRLRKVQQAIMDVSYRSPSAFRGACAVIDMTIFDLCTERWTLDILELNTCPEPAPRPAKVPRPRKERDMESVSAEEEEDETLTSDAEISYGDPIEKDDNLEPSVDENEPDSGSPMTISLEDEDAGVPSNPPRSEAAQGMPFALDSSPVSRSSLSPNPPSKRRRVSDPGRRVDVRMKVPGPFYQDDDEDIEVIDLTNAGDQSKSTLSHPGHASEDMIKTPPLNPTLLAVDIADGDEKISLKSPPLNPAPLRQDHAIGDIIETPPLNPIPPIRLKLSQPRDRPIEIEQSLPKSTGGSSPVILDSASEPAQPQTLSAALPENTNTDDADVLRMVEGMSMASIETKKDRIQLLAKIVMQLPSSEYRGFPEYLDRWIDPIYREKIQEVIRAMMNNQRKLDDVEPAESKLSMRYGALFVSWYHCASVTSAGLQPRRLQEALKAIEEDCDEGVLLSVFHKKLQSLINTYNVLHPESSRRRSLGEGSGKEDDLSLPTLQPSKHSLKRKKQYVPKAPNSVQKNAQERKAVQDRAREDLRKEREEKGLSNSDRAGQAVTFKDPIIYLNPALGEFVKPHQLLGIQFMWRELCDTDNPQGCLLAHVMGLGKTFQVISLLVTIAEAAASENPKIKAQVPEKFHRSRTVILCPAFLVPNWKKEFNCWVPPSHHLGTVFQIIAGPNTDPAERMATLQAWNEEGGVIIMSYEMFRGYIKNDQNRLSGEQHKMILDALLVKPNIVVADEAHKLKGERSYISQVTSLFETKSRIAMTGSPLANNLFEYYQMIEWVAPGYLETAQSFKEKYMEPIQDGLYIDSNLYERRASLVALKVLYGILEPKIQRADHSVIASYLPPKKELVVRVPLSETQRMAYNIFVEELRASGNFARRSNGYNKSRRRSVCIGWGRRSPPKLLSRVKALLAPIPDISDPSLSHRSLLLDRILDESKRIGDKVLVFSQSIPTLNYLDQLFNKRGRNYKRIDGTTETSKRQGISTKFNEDPSMELLLISTRAGGLGLNIHGANRVVIFDFLFNPSWEDQAIGRAYRLGQTKPVFVYRFVAAGTFEEIMFNLTLFKSQLTVRVVDQKNVLREGHKKPTKYLVPVKVREKQPVDHLLGQDPEVLDKIISDGSLADSILEITQSKVQDDENDKLSPQENLRVKDELALEQLKRSDPAAFRLEMKKRKLAEQAKAEAARLQQQAQLRQQQEEQQQKEQQKEQQLRHTLSNPVGPQHILPQKPQQQNPQRQQQGVPSVQQAANTSPFGHVGTQPAAVPSAFSQSPGPSPFVQSSLNLSSSGQFQRANPNPFGQLFQPPSIFGQPQQANAYPFGNPPAPAEMQRLLHQREPGLMRHQESAQQPPGSSGSTSNDNSSSHHRVTGMNWLPTLLAQAPGPNINSTPYPHTQARPSSTPIPDHVPVNPWRASSHESVSRYQSQPTTPTLSPPNLQATLMNSRNPAMRPAFSCDRDGNWVPTRQFPNPPAQSQLQPRATSPRSAPSALHFPVPPDDQLPPTQTEPGQ
ncbi:hypothetical protein N7451_010823 [Penicillium sp. IBT 35674x]|nr:hypothetical protein N7451_010823 [Penicillium sp. IBT 35674x]